MPKVKIPAKKKKKLVSRFTGKPLRDMTKGEKEQFRLQSKVKQAKAKPMLKAKLPNFERYMEGQQSESRNPFTANQKKITQRRYDKELLSREVSWSGGASKEEVDRFRKKNGLEIYGIDY